MAREKPIPRSKRKDFNRGLKRSRNDDEVKNFSIGLMDIDATIMYYFNNVIKPFVYQNNQRIQVPVIYASPERWKSYQKDGYYRDKGGKIMLPIIYLSRNSLTKDRSVTAKVDANQPHLYASLKQGYNSINGYFLFSCRFIQAIQNYIFFIYYFFF